MGRRADAAALLACLVLAAVTLGPAWTPEPPPASGVQVARTLPPPVPTAPAREPVPVAAPAVTPQPGPPVHLEVPSLGISAQVAPVGVQHDGALAVPGDGDVVGWYRHGPAPGAATGSAVLAGHVDTRADGEGALFRLATVEAGAEVVVTDDAGRSLRYRVVSRETIPKTDLPLDQVFARHGEHQLTLVTCGGPFDPERRRYRDNVVVVAEPAPERHP